MKKLNFKDVQTYFEYIKTTNSELNGLFLDHSDSGYGNRCAIAENLENGAINTLTSYLLYDSMYSYLQGYDAKRSQRFFN